MLSRSFVVVTLAVTVWAFATTTTVCAQPAPENTRQTQQKTVKQPNAKQTSAKKQTTTSKAKSTSAKTQTSQNRKNSKTTAKKPASARKSTPVSLTGDDAVLAAYAAYERRDQAAFAHLRVKGHVLEGYVKYWELLAKIDKTKDLAATEKEVNAFLAKWKKLPLEQPLLTAWQKELGKRGDWRRFARHDPLPNQDIELQCYSVQSRYPSRIPAALTAGKRIWNTVVNPPKACLDAFKLMEKAGDINSEDLKTRFYLLVENGKFAQARSVLGRLPLSERLDSKELAAIDKQPLRYLNSAPDPRQTGAREALFYALERVAQRDAWEARSVWVSLRDAWPPADRQYGNVRIASRAARQGLPEALQFYDEIPATTALPVAQRLEYIRIALKTGQFDKALVGIDRLPDAERNTAQWQYWRARALEAQPGQAFHNQAQQIYADLAQGINYYGVLAMERLGVVNIPFARLQPPLSSEKVKEFLKIPAVKRIAKLDELGRRTELIREWRQLTATFSVDSPLVAANALADEGLIDRSIAAIERLPFQPSPSLQGQLAGLPQVNDPTHVAVSGSNDEAFADEGREATLPPVAPGPVLPASVVPVKAEPYNDLALRFPKPFYAAFKQAADAYGVDESLLYAVARQESRFVPHIFSSAGAAGLMQLMPGTARWVARQISLSGYHVSQLKDPSINIMLGAFYLRYCLDEFGNSVALAAAAYNAGPMRARRWQALLPLEGDIWVELIPFDETRDYVKKVLFNHKIYAQLNNTNFSLLDALKLPTSGSTIAARKQLP